MGCMAKTEAIIRARCFVGANLGQGQPDVLHILRRKTYSAVITALRGSIPPVSIGVVKLAWVLLHGIVASQENACMEPLVGGTQGLTVSTNSNTDSQSPEDQPAEHIHAVISTSGAHDDT
jgi:hypothetical protein